jgi:BlaI family penicillinase repressor
MKVIWKKREVGVKEVYEALQKRKGWARNTVHTMMDRMAKKGILSQRRIGNLHVYKPLLSYGQAMKAAASDFVSRSFEGALGSTFSYLIQDTDISEEELRELRDLIDKKIKERGGKER